MIKLQDVKLLQLLPPNLKKDAHSIALSEAVEKQFSLLLQMAEQVLVYPVVGTLKDTMLDDLAKQFNIQGYTEDLAITNKRNLVQNALFFYLKAGTKQAVEEKMVGIFGDADLVEWFEGDEEPYTFSVETSNISANTTMEQQCRMAIQSTKNARSHLTGIFIKTSGTAEVYLGLVSESQEESEFSMVLI